MPSLQEVSSCQVKLLYDRSLCPTQYESFCQINHKLKTKHAYNYVLPLKNEI